MDTKFRKSPCFKCEKRSEGCHSSCEEYIEFAQAKRKANLNRKDEGRKASYAFMERTYRESLRKKK